MTDTSKQLSAEDTFERWTPAADIVEDEGRVTVRAEIPGVDKDAITVELEGDELRIEARRPAEPAGEGFEAVHVERPRAGIVYRRAFTLAPEIKRDGVAAAYEDGVLTLTLDKHERPKPRRIQVS